MKLYFTLHFPTSMPSPIVTRKIYIDRSSMAPVVTASTINSVKLHRYSTLLFISMNLVQKYFIIWVLKDKFDIVKKVQLKPKSQKVNKVRNARILDADKGKLNEKCVWNCS